MALSCEEIHEQITAYVDDRVDEKEYRRQVAAHIESCSACRDEYEREIMTKMVIRQRFPTVGTPAALRSTIEEGLDAQTPRTYSRRTSGSYSSRRRSPQRSVFLLLLVIAGLATYILLFNDSDPAPQPVQTETSRTSSRRTPVTSASRPVSGPLNPFNVAIANYEAARAGRFSLGEQATDLAQLKTYFQGKGISSLTFAGVPLPLKGGSVIAQDGVPMPHLVYGDANTTLYLFEISWENLRNGKGMSVTEEVTGKLEGGEPVWVQVSNTANLVMYKNGEAVDIVVANRPKADMERMLGIPG